MPIRRTLPAGVTTALLCAGVAAPPYLGSASTAAARSARPDPFERAVLRRVNRIRRSFGLRRLHPSHALALAAARHSSEILRSNVISHSSPDGTPMSRRVRRYVRARSVGETIAWVTTGTRGQAAVVVSAWMHSPPHRAALLSRRFRRVGVGRRVGELGGRRYAVTTLDMASAR